MPSYQNRSIHPPMNEGAFRAILVNPVKLVDITRLNVRSYTSSESHAQLVLSSRTSRRGELLNFSMFYSAL